MSAKLGGNMKTLLIFVKMIGFGLKISIFLLIEVISLVYMIYRIIGKMKKIIFYGVKLNMLKYRYKNKNLKNKQNHKT
jgi:hypothetical protein